MAGDKVIMPANALMMLYDPACFAMGETADIIDKVRDMVAADYVQKTGMEREKVISMMDAETWMSAEEAHELGFCDAVTA